MGNSGTKPDSENSSEFDIHEFVDSLPPVTKDNSNKNKKNKDKDNISRCATGAGCSSDAEIVEFDVTPFKKCDDQYVDQLTPLRLKEHAVKNVNGKWNVPYSYHKQADALNPLTTTLATRTKRIQREVAKLQDSLPISADSSIFVCIDEHRHDIIKAMVTGQRDTPYSNGCFEFDVFFPEEYPHKPLLLNFITTGDGKVRFNPNLYANGYVCLSVINTWNGRPEEQWNPSLSLHKVLLAVQAFVFVKDPFFNEPGFNKMKGGEWGTRCSEKYNMRVRHATLLHACLNQLKNENSCFKNVIRNHFALKKDEIIAQAQAWYQELKKTADCDSSGSEEEIYVSFPVDSAMEMEATTTTTTTTPKQSAKNKSKEKEEKAKKKLDKKTETGATAAAESNKKEKKGGIGKLLSSLTGGLNSVIPSGGIPIEKMEQTVQLLIDELNKLTEALVDDSNDSFVSTNENGIVQNSI